MSTLDDGTTGVALTDEKYTSKVIMHDAEANFIRCIKPNKEKVPNNFTADMVTDQLTLSGAMETVKIRQTGFLPARRPVDVGHFQAMAPRILGDACHRQHRCCWFVNSGPWVS